MKNKNRILTSIFVISICLSTAYAWKVEKDSKTQMKLTDEGRLWIGANAQFGHSKLSTTTTDAEDRALDARADRITGTNYGVVATASGNGADMNVGLYGSAQNAANNYNYGLYVDSGYGYFRDKVGIGTTSPTKKLHVNGAAIANSWNTTSDERLKKQIKTINNALEKTIKLRGVIYKWKDSNKSQKNQIGFIAQEVEKIVPEVVNKPINTDDFYSINYANLTALLVESIKELKKQNDALKALVCQDHPDSDICIETSK